MKNQFLLILFLIIPVLIFSNIPDAKDIFDNEEVVQFISYIKTGNDQAVQELIKNGFDIDSKSENGITPMYYFLLKKDFKSFKKTLELGANPNIEPDGIGFYNALAMSMRYQDERYFKLLIEFNAEINFYSGYTTQILEYVLYDSVDIKYLKLLIELNIKPYYADDWISNPILKAASYKAYKKIILLLDYYPEYLADNRKIKLYKGDFIIKEIFINRIEQRVHFEGTQDLKDQQELVKYLKEKFNIEVHLKYPNGRPRSDKYIE